MGICPLISIYMLLAFQFSTSQQTLPNFNDDVKLETAVKWAEEIGETLWKIGSQVTQLENIKKRYSEMNASVEKTDGEEILKTIAIRMNKLIKEKVDAVLRIKNAAMEAENAFVSLNAKKDDIMYMNSKFSAVNVTDANLTISKNDNTDEDGQQGKFYDMVLSKDPHFNDVLVNTNYSSVHVPTNIYDRWDFVIEPIVWSENMDETFRSNFLTDSSLMWQYFASTSGFLRHFPAFHWSMDPDEEDCRRRIWYIQAATCSKEAVVLIDNSGTMYGMRNTIAQLTVDNLLQTFSNNDYINVMRLYDDNVTCLVSCFNDTLIQATPENIDLFRSALYLMCPEKKINYRVGFLKAFTMLHDFMLNKTNPTAESRNQAVFLLTDTIPPDVDLISIREDYDRIYNDTNIQVDLFIYFIGKDIPEIREIQWDKCLRNGSVVHVRTMDEVPEDALKYLAVMARTQNESTENYPVSWTHLFLDIKKDKGIHPDLKNSQKNSEEDDEEDEYFGSLDDYRMMTSVSAPVYTMKKKKRSEVGFSQPEEMIGVAAIDVPISDFERLTMAHKIGVNGYAFVVTNNGYLLFHPDLRPVKDRTLRTNFNSIDLTEVEFYDDGENRPRKPNQMIYNLRKEMVEQLVGNKPNMSVKFHYDDQKRVGSEYRNYFYAPLKCSSFSLGLALPGGYGNYWVKTTNEIENSKNNNETYGDFFKGNWFIHPKWSYCDYRDNRKYNFTSAKQKLMSFFEMIFHDPDFKWVEEHIETEFIKNDNYSFDSSFEKCFANHTTVKPDREYFCDKELVELLYFDAKLTQKEFPDQIEPEVAAFMDQHRIKTKFVATQGGLTRWQGYPDEESDFGEKYGKALDEVWYKTAVLLHDKNAHSFVFSIPKNITHKNGTSEKFMTATKAIFYTEDDNEAPGVVVGFQIAYEILQNEIVKISACDRSATRYDCYVIDANGYIIYSQNMDEIGQFFSTVEGGAAMDQLVADGKFRQISMFDYQAFTEGKKKDSSKNTSSSLFNPLRFITWTLNWAFTKFVWILIQTNLWQYVQTAPSSCSSVTSINPNTTCFLCKPDKSTGKTCPLCCKAPKEYEDACQTREVLPHIEKRLTRGTKVNSRPVDKKFFLYLFKGIEPEGYSHNVKNNRHENCSRPFYAVRINKTNLILIMLDTFHETCKSNLSIEQEVIVYDSPYPEYKDTPACNKKMINSYPRKKLRGCSDKMPANKTTESCGLASVIEINRITIFSCCTVITFYRIFIT